MLEPAGPALAGVAGAMMTEEGVGGLTVESCYPDEPTSEDTELARIPAAQEEADSPSAAEPKTPAPQR